MHLTVIDEDSDVTGIRTGERALGHLVIESLEDGRHEARVDGSTDNAVVELKPSAPFEVELFLGLDVEDNILAVNLELVRERNAFNDRADEDGNLTELTGSTGLLLVTVSRRSHLRDGLTVRNLRSEHNDLHTELVLQTPLADIDVLLALAAEDSLFEFL